MRLWHVLLFLIVLPGIVVGQQQTVRDSAVIMRSSFLQDFGKESVLKGVNGFKPGYIPDFSALPKEFSSLNIINSSPVRLEEADISYIFQRNESYIIPGTYSTYGDVELNSSWSVASVPFQVSISNQNWNDLSANNIYNPSLHFDKDTYLSLLKDKLKDKIKPDQFIDVIKNNPLDLLRNNAEKVLQSDLESINKDFGGGLQDKLEELGDLNTVVSGDRLAIKEKLLTANYLKSIEDKERILAELVNRKNTGQPVDKNQINSLEKEVNKLRGVNALVAKVEEHKRKWQSSGLMDKIKQAGLQNKKLIQDISKDPSLIKKLAKEHLNLSKFQKLFLNINKLNIGQNTLSESPLSLSHLVNKGINMEFANNKKFLMLGLGKARALPSVLDQTFESPGSMDAMARMMRIGLGDTKSSSSHISVMSFNQSMNSTYGLAALEAMRNVLVTTFSNEMKIGTGTLNIEVSRSATSYPGSVTSDSLLENKSAINRVVSTDDFFRNMAFAVRYEDRIENENSFLQYGIHVGKTAIGYTNPGNSFLNSGGKELGFNLKKSLLKRKAQLSVRSDLREFNYGEDPNKIWRNTFTVVDFKWRLKKGQYISLRYLPNKMLRIDNKVKQIVTSFSRLSLDGNVSKKLSGVYYRNTFSVARQMNSYSMNNDLVRASTIAVSSFQNVTIGKKMFYTNLNYDYSNNSSPLVYFNSSFLTETGIAYLILKKVSLSSALSYNSVASWYRQIGIKQTLSTQIGERFNLNLYVDARKSLKVYQPLLYGPVRADISMYYSIVK